MSAEPWAHLISIEAILKIHTECIARFGGDTTEIAKEGCLERSAGAAFNAESYLENPEAEPGLCFAGCLLFYLIKKHCFVDGNKRVGWAACMEVLRSLGLTVIATTDEIEELCLAIADNNSDLVIDAVGATVWLAPRLVAL
jgi:death-on-curing protein